MKNSKRLTITQQRIANIVGITKDESLSELRQYFQRQSDFAAHKAWVKATTLKRIERLTGVEKTSKQQRLTNYFQNIVNDIKAKEKLQGRKSKRAIKIEEAKKRKAVRKLKAKQKNAHGIKAKIKAFEIKRNTILSFFENAGALSSYTELKNSMKDMFTFLVYDKKSGNLILNQDALNASEFALQKWYQAIGLSSVRMMTDEKFNALHTIGGFWRKLSQDIPEIQPQKAVIAQFQKEADIEMYGFAQKSA